mmetsp:Transcript_124294/g.295011  ORF Transcript_124294/g.295011 Transcript_124294/m.295011 type:complete len:217 (+) Transcript_124294:358-1008(+)
MPQHAAQRLGAARGKEALRCVRVLQIMVFHLQESLRLLMRVLGHSKAQALVLSIEHGVVLLQERNTQHEERAVGRRNVQGHQRQVARLIVGVMLRREREQLRLAATAVLLDCKSELRELRPLFAVLDAQLVCEVVDDVLRPGDLRGAGVDGHVAAFADVLRLIIEEDVLDLDLPVASFATDLEPIHLGAQLVLLDVAESDLGLFFLCPCEEECEER